MIPADIYLVLTNLPDRDSAGRLAHALIEKRLAACVNVLSPCRSVYRWQGKMEGRRGIPDADQDHPRALPCSSKRRSAQRILTNFRRSSRSHWREACPRYLEWVDSETRPA